MAYPTNPEMWYGEPRCADRLVNCPIYGTRLLWIGDSRSAQNVTNRMKEGIRNRFFPPRWAGWTASCDASADNAIMGTVNVGGGANYANTNMTVIDGKNNTAAFDPRGLLPNTGSGVYSTASFTAPGYTPLSRVNCNATNIAYFSSRVLGNGDPWSLAASPITARFIWYEPATVGLTMTTGWTITGQSGGVNQTAVQIPAGTGGALRYVDASCGTGADPEFTVQGTPASLPNQSCWTINCAGRIWMPAVQNGLEVAFWSVSGYTTTDHSSTSVCSDAIRQAYLAALDSNLFVYFLGTNPATNEASEFASGPSATYIANMLANIDKHRALNAARGGPQCTPVIIVSDYVNANLNQAYCRNLWLANKAICDARPWVMAVNLFEAIGGGRGTLANLSASPCEVVLLSGDNIHQVIDGCDVMAGAIWTICESAAFAFQYSRKSRSARAVRV